MTPQKTTARRRVRIGTIVAKARGMSAQTRSRGFMSLLDDDSDEDPDTSAIVRVPCPGKAHRTGEECLVCDEDSDGLITVVITEIELNALGCAAQGRPVDPAFGPRLRALGLLHDLAGCPAPTEQGYALLGGPLLRAN